MSTKPATLPRWATNLTNNDAPSSGQADTGWTPGQTAVSDYFNYLGYWTYKWCEYLNDGDVTFSDLTWTGKTVMSGEVAFDLSGAAASTAIDPGDASVIDVTYTTFGAGLGAVSGIIGGVDGRELTLVNKNSTFVIPIKHEDTSATAANRIVMVGGADIGGIVMRQYGAVKLRYVGEISRWVVAGTSFSYDWAPARFVTVNHIHCYVPAAHTFSPDGHIVAASVSPIYYPIDLPAGAIITSYTLFLDKNTDGTNNIQSRLYSVDPDGAVVALGAGNGITSGIALQETGLSITVSSDLSYYLKFTPGGGVAPAADRLYFLKIGYTFKAIL